MSYRFGYATVFGLLLIGGLYISGLRAADPVPPMGPNVLPPAVPNALPPVPPVPLSPRPSPVRTAPPLPPTPSGAPTETAPAPAPAPTAGPIPSEAVAPPRREEYYPYGYGYDKDKYHAGSTMENLKSTHSYRHGRGYQPDSAGDPSLYYADGGYTGGNYPNPVGSPYHWGPRWNYAGGNAYDVHFGPGVYRNREFGHLRFPYYNYRAPWYHPGPATYVRDTNLHW